MPWYITSYQRVGAQKCLLNENPNEWPGGAPRAVQDAVVRVGPGRRSPGSTDLRGAPRPAQLSVKGANFK